MENPHPLWHQWVLWSITIGTWVSLTFVLWPGDPPAMTMLIKNENTALLNEIEEYLQRQGVAYVRDERNQIKVDSEQHRWIENQLRARDMIGYKDQSSLQTKSRNQDS